jgi:hypothetical protein
MTRDCVSVYETYMHHRTYETTSTTVRFFTLGHGCTIYLTQKERKFNLSHLTTTYLTVQLT